MIPELGPLLGRLAAPPVGPAIADPLLESIRLDLLSALYDRAGNARTLAAAGDPIATRHALGPPVWLEVWESAVAAAATAISAEIVRRLRVSAAISRYPKGRITALLPSPEDARILRAQLSAAGIRLEEATAQLATSGPEWNEMLRRVAGELEGAWEELCRTARQELDFWDRRAAEVRAWRRPWRPLLLIGAMLIVMAGWLGLMLGGYLPVPPFLRPLAEWYWSLPWP